ncbi:glycosyltransferase [Photobacterium damselae subsp. damselae]|uniref:Glycosyltransferase n=1 Tax=Photobacterium damselae subsp. damselae TaxID=85581 RepID=A0A850QXH5_PHODD|nr:glycosyltransferase [Photobacterium damselae subsp. damselae]
MRNLTIIIPVYRGLDETKECILSVIDNIPPWANLLVINDSSPEVELTDWLREHAAEKSYSLYENEINLGFVETVNKGMILAGENDVLLLNSDVESPNSDWLVRMREAAYIHEYTASLTPFSNNATICSFPNFCEDNTLFKNLNVTEIDEIFRNLDLEQKLVEIPTGVGFCMYIRRDCLQQVGYFDVETFGKGYGEENDWCQRAAKLGWKNYHLLNVFSYHKGGVSFAEEGDERKDYALKALLKLHPDYNVDVQKFVADDPARLIRLKALFDYFRNSNNIKILLITHSLGGGVAQHIDELEKEFYNKVDFLKIYPSNTSQSVCLSFGNEVNDKYIFELPSDFELLVNILKYIGIDSLHIHHTIGLHESVLSLPKLLNVDYDVTIHDYFLINGNPTLTNKYGEFAGDDILIRDDLCSVVYPLNISLDEWKKKSKRLLLNARRIIYPSCDTARRFIAEYPSIKLNSMVAYHPDLDSCDFNVKGIKFPVKIKKVLVFGAISQEKGADKLEISGMNNKEIEFHLLGYAYRKLKNVITHGAYDSNDVEKLINEIKPDVIWFPAQCPETYSYTLSTAIKLEYPIIAPNIGAFSERLMNRDGVIILPWDITNNDIIKFWQNNCKVDEGKKEINNTHSFDSINPIIDFYKDYYISAIIKKENHELINPINEELSSLVCVHELTELSKKEQLLVMLWKVRSLPVIANIIKYIPTDIQRKIKRKLSTKPMHELDK